MTDGHHNRVLRVSLDGEITELITFDNIVPTGLAVWGNKVYMAEAGPSPTCPRPAGSSRSARSRRPPQWWQRVRDSSWTSNSAGVAASTPSRRVCSGTEIPRVHQRCQTLAAS